MLWNVVGAVVVLSINFAACGQELNTKYTFTNTPDGSGPLRLAQANGLLFGSTSSGGTSGNGTIFSFDAGSSKLTTLYSFNGGTGSGGSPNNVIVSGNKIYGVAQVGGTNNVGMIYSIGTNGSGFTPLYSFGGNPDGRYPAAGLAVGNGVLFGTAFGGGVGSGASAGGTVFKINTNGLGYATLHSFTNNPDGSQPQGEVIVNGNTLYGTTTYGGTYNYGTIYSMNTDGSGYTVLHSFTNNPEPGYPYGALVLANGVLYGTGSYGGSYNNGAIFAMNANGTGFRVLYSFSGYTGNLDGATPRGTLTLSGSNLLGATSSGGSGNGGTIFMINTNGTGFQVIETFTNSASSGSTLLAGVIRSGNAIWGTTFQGGINNNGTIFQLPMPVILSQPQSITISNAMPAAFSVSVLDDLKVTYQWYLNNSILAGQTNSSLAFASATNKNAGIYTVVVSDASGSVTSSPATLSIIGGPVVITQQPQGVVTENGNSATFTVAASGTGPLHFQWYFKTNTIVKGATNASVTLTNVIASMAGTYSVKVTNSFGSVSSSYASLTVTKGLNLLSFTLNPAKGSASFALANAAKSTNRLWATTNLASPGSWKVLAKNVLSTNGLWFFTDTNAMKTNKMLFYRFSTP